MNDKEITREGLKVDITLEEQKRNAQRILLENKGFECLTAMINGKNGGFNSKSYSDSSKDSDWYMGNFAEYFKNNGYGEEVPEINHDYVRIASIIGLDYKEFKNAMNSHYIRVHPHNNVYVMLIGRDIYFSTLYLFFEKYDIALAEKIMSYCIDKNKDDKKTTFSDEDLRDAIADVVEAEIIERNH